MIVDTGANITIIWTDLAQGLGEKLIWTPPIVSLQTVTGDKIEVLRKINLNVTFGNATYQHAAYVADISDPFILGLDFLKEYNFKLDFKNNKLHSSSEHLALFNTRNPGIKPVQQIIVNSETMIPPRTELIIPGTISEETNFRYGLIEYPDSGNGLKGVLIASSVVDLSGSVVPVRIANASDKFKVIKATCAPITCINQQQPAKAESSETLKKLLESADLNNDQKSAAEKLISEFHDLFSRTPEDVGSRGG